MNRLGINMKRKKQILKSQMKTWKLKAKRMKMASHKAMEKQHKQKKNDLVESQTKTHVLPLQETEKVF